jgi:hypothetical protein
MEDDVRVMELLRLCEPTQGFGFEGELIEVWRRVAAAAQSTSAWYHPNLTSGPEATTPCESDVRAGLPRRKGRESGGRHPVWNGRVREGWHGYGSPSPVDDRESYDRRPALPNAFCVRS